jgi:hypothetical protein
VHVHRALGNEIAPASRVVDQRAIERATADDNERREGPAGVAARHADGD